MAFYECPCCGYRGNPTYWDITLGEHLANCPKNPARTTICIYCNQTIIARDKTTHYKNCLRKPKKEYEKCSYCGKIVEKLLEHKKICERNPLNIRFSENPTEQKFNKIKITHKPFPNDTERKSARCRNEGCENPVGLKSDICFDCIRNSK